MSVENPNAGTPAGGEGATTPAGDPSVGDSGAQVSGLPSHIAENTAAQGALSFELNDVIKEKYLTADGKVLGKYTSLEQLVESHKNLQDKHAQYVEQVKKDQEQINGGIEDGQKQAQRLETMQTLLPQFLENNMELTPEMEQVLTDTGLDIRDVKLGAIELRDRINNAHSVVGGKEEYQAMMAWATQNLSDADKKAFDQDVMSTNSRFAIKGLYGEYQAAVAAGTVNNDTDNTRLMGNDTTNLGIKPYADKRELFADKQYIDSPAGRRDTAAQKRYQARLAVTPESVWRGY